MITKDILKQVLASNQKDVERYKVMFWMLSSNEVSCRVFGIPDYLQESYSYYSKDTTE